MSLEIIKETQSICKEQLNREDITPEERVIIWQNLMEVTKMVPILDKENKKFYENLNSKYVKATVAALLSALVFIGGKVALDQFSGLPLENKEDEEDEDK